MVLHSAWAELDAIQVYVHTEHRVSVQNDSDVVVH
jgi:hypothetical protein